MAGIVIEIQDLAVSKFVFDFAEMYGKTVDTVVTPSKGRVIKPFGVLQPSVASGKTQGASTTWYAKATIHPVFGTYRQLVSTISPGLFATRSATVQTGTEQVIEEYATLAGDMDGVEVNGWTCGLVIWGRRTTSTSEIATLRMDYYHKDAVSPYTETLLDSYTTGDLTTSFARYAGSVSFTQTWDTDDLLVIKLVGANEGLPE